jgi:hypothetical protein
MERARKSMKVVWHDPSPAFSGLFLIKSSTIAVLGALDAGRTMF